MTGGPPPPGRARLGGPVPGARTVYYDHRCDASLQPAFPRGEAGPVILSPDGEWTAETQVWIGPNSHCALVHHGVVTRIAALPGPGGRGALGDGRDLLLPPSASEALARVFYEADRKTYGARYDFLAATGEGPVHYRIAIDNREYQKTLSQLQYLSTTAARYGHGLRLRL